MRIFGVCLLLLLSACGVDSAASLVTLGKLQTEQARHEKERADALKGRLDAASAASLERTEHAVEGGGGQDEK